MQRSWGSTGPGGFESSEEAGVAGAEWVKGREGGGGDKAGVMCRASGAAGKTWAFTPRRWEPWRAHRRPLATVGSTDASGKGAGGS